MLNRMKRDKRITNGVNPEVQLNSLGTKRNMYTYLCVTAGLQERKMMDRLLENCCQRMKVENNWEGIPFAVIKELLGCFERPGKLFSQNPIAVWIIAVMQCFRLNLNIPKLRTLIKSWKNRFYILLVSRQHVQGPCGYRRWDRSGHKCQRLFDHIWRIWRFWGAKTG